MTAQEVIQTLQQAGFSGIGLVQALAVVMAESSLDPFAHATHGEDSRGLFQINVVPAAHPEFADVNLYDPLTNAKAAYRISKGGTDWHQWSTWTNGAAARNLAAAASFVTNSVGAIVQPKTPIAGVPAITQAPTVKLPSIDTSSIGAALGSIAATLQAIPVTLTKPFADFFAGIGQLGTWLDQPNLWLRVAMGLFGGFLVMLGLILFGLSLIPANSGVAKTAKELPLVAAAA